MMELTRLLLEGAGAALLAVAVFFLYTVSDRLQTLADAVGNLRLEIAKEYMTKGEYSQYRERVHALANDMGLMSNRITFLEAGGKK